MAVLVVSTFLGAPSAAQSSTPLARAPYQAPYQIVVTQPSSPAAIALAEHLAGSNAVMYGAYWCPHCQEQKKLFGAEGAEIIPYIECDADGKDAQPEKCRAAQIDGFPTWIVNGEILSGTQSLEALAEASGFDGTS